MGSLFKLAKMIKYYLKLILNDGFEFGEITNPRFTQKTEKLIGNPIALRWGSSYLIVGDVYCKRAIKKILVKY